MHRPYAARVAAKLCQLQSVAEVLIVSEAHGLSADIDTFHREFPHFVAWLSVGERVGAGGLAILVLRSALQSMPELEVGDWRREGVRFAAQVPGRIAYVDIAAGRGSARIAGVHIPPQLTQRDRKSMLRRLRSLTFPLADAATVLVGDFNMTHGVDGNVADGRPDIVRMDGISQLWSAYAPEYGEIASTPARRQVVGGEFVGFSTLDRAFVHLGEADLLEVAPTLVPMRDVADRGPPSEHVPIFLRSAGRGARRRRPGIPDYIASDPRLGGVRDYYAQQVGLPDGPSGHLLMLKSCMLAVSVRLRAELWRAPPRTVGARLG